MRCWAIEKVEKLMIYILRNNASMVFPFLVKCYAASVSEATAFALQDDNVKSLFDPLEVSLTKIRFKCFATA